MVNMMFKCKWCVFKAQTINQYVQHCRLHSNVPRMRFPCCISGCMKTSATYDGLRQHIKREHNSTRLTGVNAKFQEVGVTLHCGVTSCTAVSNDASSLIKHLYKHMRDGVSVTCPIKHCNKSYHVKSSFSGHLSRDHMQWSLSDLKGQTSEANNDLFALEPGSSSELTGDFDTDNDVYEDSTVCPLPINMKDLFTRNLSLFFVKLMSHHLVPESVVDVISRELQNINATSQIYLEQNISAALNNSGISSDHIVSVMNAVRDSDMIKCCLDEGGSLHSTHRRSTYLETQFHYVQPESIYVGINSHNKPRYCYYVPVKKSLQALLSDSSVLHQCLTTRFENSNILADFADGSVYKKCATAVNAPNKCLPLILFQDSFQVANPLGSAKKKFKIMGFYFVLGSLKAHNRSATDHIQLLMLALENDVFKVGQRIFQRLIDDLRSLETDGFEVDGHHFRVIVPAITGDNLGSHWLGGFTMNFAYGPHICRYCTITKRELDNGSLCTSVNRLRTVDSYNQSLMKLSTDELAVHDGVKFNSLFNTLSSFHVCNPGLPPCVAHDLFEGVVSYDLPLFLKALVSIKGRNNFNNKLSVAVLNRRLECFKFLGADAAVKPPQLKSCLDKLSGSASQNWCLLRILPLLIADVTDVSNAVYQAILLLRSVCELVMAPHISIGQVCEMKVHIEDYLERRQNLFPDTALRPKHHYMTHYAHLTLQFGPLIKLWTMRFEAKHQYFKRCIRSSRNFLNVPGLLATRHQMCQAYLSASLRFACDIDVSNADIVLDSEIATDVKQVLITAEVQPGQVFMAAKVKGTMYKRGLVLVLKACCATKILVFGEILLIVVQGQSSKMVVKSRNAQFDYCTGCYILDHEHGVQIVSLDCLADYYPLPVYNVNGHSTVVLRHQIVDQD